MIASSTTNALKRAGFAALLSVGVAMSGFATSTGTAAADAWPGCPPDNPSGPCRWCPGMGPVETGNKTVNPVVWDENVCHTYWYVYHGQGNVASNIFEGEFPPPPPPPPPNLTPPLPPGWCWSLFIPTPCP